MDGFGTAEGETIAGEEEEDGKGTAAFGGIEEEGEGIIGD
jgi:hypothetical protein